MTVFVVTARAATKADIEAAINRVFEDKFFKFNDLTWFITAKGTSKAISDQLGVKNGGISGVVVAPISGAYYGVASTAFWDWIRAAIEEGEDG